MGPAAGCVPGAVEQRCWFHASGDVIDHLPKRLHSRMKGLLSEIVEASARKDAQPALETFREELRRHVSDGPDRARSRLGPADRVLQLPGRPLAAPADHESHREQLRDRTGAHAGDEWHQGPRQRRWRFAYKLLEQRTSAGGGSTATTSSPTCSRA
jgi:hypothetical protein